MKTKITSSLLCLSLGLLPSIVEAEIPSLETQTTNQQLKHQVSGVIVDSSSKEPLIGVSILVKGTSSGTVTDIDGKFSLSVSASDILELSYVGYKTQTIKVGAKDYFEINLSADKKLLDEVVVVGYGSMKKSDLTGAVVSANLKDFKKTPHSNVIEVLQGTVPGLNVGQVTSAGSTPSFSIRGTNTLSGKTDVLIVLDGIIYSNSLSSINPNDIESIDVLKDASATAVYGAQAANGVLLITTKRGKKGKTKIDFSTSLSLSSPTKDIRPMNRSEYLEFTRNLWYEEAFQGPDYKTPNPDFRLASKLPDTVMMDPESPDGIVPYDYDWWDEGTQSGSIWENKLSMSGGSDGINYLISYSNTNQQGYILNDNFKRNTVRVNLDIQPFPWLKTGIQASGSFVKQDGAEPNVTVLMRQNPLCRPYDDAGELIPYPFNTLDTNPFMSSDVVDKERHNYFFANIYANVKLPIKGLTYRFNFGNNYVIDEYFNANTYGASLNGSANKRHGSSYDWTFDNIVDYVGKFGKHDISATFVYGARERKYNGTNAWAEKFPRLNLGFNSIQLGKDQYVNTSAWEEASLYQMLRLNYKLLDRYLVTATVRRDGFSGFAKNNKSAIFPSVALGWVMSEENWFNIPFINLFKLRAGWGISGNQTTRYKSLSRVDSYPGYVFGDGQSTEMAQHIASMGNNNLKWEKTTGVNMGLDFAVLNSRISGSLEYYNTTTRDLLYDMVLPSMTGFQSVSTNLGKIRNQGVEFSITSHNIQNKDFEWSTTFNISANRNKIVTLLGKDENNDGKEDDLISSGLFIGKDISSVYDYKINGIWQLKDEIPQGFHPGNYRIVDTDGKEGITPDDRVILGKTNPAYRFGILNKLSYKDFSLSFFINSVQGGKDGYMGYNSNSINRGNSNSRRWNSASDMAKKCWSPQNPNGVYACYHQSPMIGGTRYQQRNFIRLQDISLGYNVPKTLLSYLGIENVNLFVSGKNLITITKWDGWDPEAYSGYYGRPVLKSFTFGLNVTL